MIVTAAKAGDAAKVLGVELDGLTSSTLGAAYKKAVVRHHPDKVQGAFDPAKWAAITAAKATLLAWIESGRTHAPAAMEGDCRACGGTGRVSMTKGFGPGLPMQCVMCGGAGSLNTERVKEGDRS